ncbi:hypothetical protein IM511_07135 [Erythrobacteraceae bacterium E2-1 Yellow Sea]|nr:hypothetical protein [Erythrobacteraceae bacterium E2-1 Yellow Sea]
MSLYDRSNVKSQTRLGGSLLSGSDQKSRTHQLIFWILIAIFAISILLNAVGAANLTQLSYPGGKLGFFLNGFSNSFFVAQEYGKYNPTIPLALSVLKIFMMSILTLKLFKKSKNILIYCIIASALYLFSFIFSYIFLTDLLNIELMENYSVYYEAVRDLESKYSSLSYFTFPFNYLFGIHGVSSVCMNLYGVLLGDSLIAMGYT